ncbi:protein phosphatase 1 regulatory subunit 3A [Erinaceus europaeus]|uniref:Protein phosphatase 1 regulatory subunit 3A n=1 Tax=Erinaceus europaeus TaxID=9365 RepID=A0A1S2ZA31_ERIEU|nr:protein phosphatase 1 regulatory subunit 3A [Erinaceus europaeus]
MESAEEPSQTSKDNFLEVPNSSDSLYEDEEVKAAFKLGFSPQPSRRGSDSFEDMYLDTPPSGTRRVSFADTFGFNLVSVKEFDCWELPSVSTNFDLRNDIFHTEYFLSPLFDLPSSREDLMQHLQVQKAVLESTEYLPGSTCMKGIIRVLNISFEKLVYVRMSLDDWQTHYDILAEYVPNSCDGETDQFSFKISLVPPYQKDGSKVEFCIRYETSVGTFWSNNNGANYILVCQKKEQDLEPIKPREEVLSRQIKGCLKVKSSKEESSITSNENGCENSNVTDTYIPTIVCSHEEKEDLEASDQNVKEHDEHNEKELDLMINQHLKRTGHTASRDEKNTFSTDTVNLPNKSDGLEKKQKHGKVCTDLFKRPLSPSSSIESSIERHIHHNEKCPSEKEYIHQTLEETASNVGEIKLLQGDTTSDELIQLNRNRKELLGDNANPAQERDKKQLSCPSSFQLIIDNPNTTHEERAKEVEMEDGEYLRRSFPSNESVGKGSSKSGDEDDQRIFSGVSEEQRNFQSILKDQGRKTRHSDLSIEETGASNRDLTALPWNYTTISTQITTADIFPSLRANLNWEETVLTAPQHNPLASEGCTLGGTSGQVCSPKNENVLGNDYTFQVVKEESEWIYPEDWNRNVPYKQNWKVQKSQGEVKTSITNMTGQIKEQKDYEDVRGKSDNTRSLRATTTGKLFTCQETVSCKLSSLADHGKTEKAEAGTAYIIKTTSESMSARENAIIAKLSQETAQSDRPTEVKETVFDPHEGRNDDSHDTLCQRDTVHVIYDNDSEKESCLGICNVHVDETKKEDTISMYNPGKLHDRKKHGIGNTASVEESLQLIKGNQKAVSTLDLHLGVLPTDTKIFQENRDHEQIQEFSKKMNADTFHLSALNSDNNRVSPKDSQVVNHHGKTSASSHKQEIAIENKLTTMALQSMSTKSEYNCNPTSEMQSIEKYCHPSSKPEEVSKSSETLTSSSKRERCVSRILRIGERNVGKSLGPMILVSEAFENMKEAKHENAGLVNSGQLLCPSDDKDSESSASASLSVQESQAQSSESLLSRYTHSKMSHLLLFLIFLATIYHYDLMIGLAFYLCSLFWLSWEGGRQKESVKKK